MGKFLSTILLTLGLTSGVFAQDMDAVRSRIYLKIDKEMRFNKCSLSEYIRAAEYSVNNGEYIIAHYDLNDNGKEDLIACFRPLEKDTLICHPANSSQYAEIVMFDNFETGFPRWTYIDYDLDGEFDEVEFNLHKQKFLPRKIDKMIEEKEEKERKKYSSERRCLAQNKL